MEIKIQEFKQKQKQSLMSYARKHDITIDIEKVGEQEDKLLEELKGVEDILNAMKGTSPWGDELAENIKKGRYR